MSNSLTEMLEAMHVHRAARAAALDERTRQRITNAFWRAQNQRQQTLALAIDLATLVAWLQSLWRRARH